MKLTRSELKSLIKECLIEILTDSTPRPVPVTPKRYSAIAEQKSSKANKITDDSIRSITAGNPMMEQIFRDTAENTLPAQEKSDRTGAVGIVEQTIAEVPPADIFGSDTINKWAKYANLI